MTTLPRFPPKNIRASAVSAVDWYSCRARGEGKKRTPIQDSPPLEAKEPLSLTWAQCLERTYEINPLECPNYMSEMRILAFVANQQEISKLATSVGIPKATAPPSNHKRHNRSYALKFPVKTSSKRWRRGHRGRRTAALHRFATSAGNDSGKKTTHTSTSINKTLKH